MQESAGTVAAARQQLIVSGLPVLGCLVHGTDMLGCSMRVPRRASLDATCIRCVVLAAA